MKDHNYVVTDDGPCAVETCGRPPVEHPDYEPVFSDPDKDPNGHEPPIVEGY